MYLSPWDRNHKDYGKPEYVTYYHNQLRELLTNYGPLFEIWFDGANGGDGWYGGAREKRTIGPDYYQWDKIMAIVQECQPEAVCFGRRDIRWVGNELGVAPDPCWATEKRHGKTWWPAECDFPLRRGWFWHPGGHGRHSASQLVDRYFQSIGRNSAMDLGIAPDRRGLMDAHDVDVLKGFGERIQAIFATNLASTATASASNVRIDDATYSANNVLVGTSKFKTYWAAYENVKSAEITVEFKKPTTFSVISLREPIQLGHRIDGWALEAWKNNQWEVFAKGMGIGARRLWRGEPIVAEKIRLCITNASASPALSEFAVYLEPEVSRKESIAMAEISTEKGLDKSLWDVRSATAQGHPAKYAIDGCVETFWHTHTEKAKAMPPQSVVVDMGREEDLTGFLYLPRQDSCTVGNVTRYVFETSLDGKSWSEALTNEFGNIAANPVLQKGIFAKVFKARYFKFTATDALGGCVNGHGGWRPWRGWSGYGRQAAFVAAPGTGTAMLLHLRTEFDPLAGCHEVAVAKVVDRLRADHRPVEPRPDHLQHEEPVPGHHPGVGHPALRHHARPTPGHSSASPRPGISAASDRSRWTARLITSRVASLR